MKKTLFAMLATAAALSASATQLELLTNGEGSTLDGWVNTGTSQMIHFVIYQSEGYNWFCTYAEVGENKPQVDAKLSQTVDLVEAGIPEVQIQKSPIATASAIVYSYGYNITCNVKVYQLDASGNVIESATQTVFDGDGKPTSSAQSVTNSFALNPNARKLKYELNGQESWGPYGKYGARFRNCSLKIEVVESSVVFASNGTTVGTTKTKDISSVVPPVASRAGDYKFLGYYTDDGVQIFNESYEYAAGSSWSPTDEITLYAHWAVPEGSIAKLVYRGQLTLLGTDSPATDTQTYTKTMHFRVYDGESATTPVWQIDNQTVTVNKDGSFMATFGDEALAALIATGAVTHVGVAIGPNAGQAIELKPRRELRPVAAVNRALVAEAAGKDSRVGNLVTENALAANNVTISQLEVAGTVTAPGAGPVDVSPVVVGERETLTLLRGGGVNVFSKNRVDLGTTANVQRGQKIGSGPAPSDGFALITSSKSGARGLRIPGVIQYCRKGEYVRAPASEPDGVKVTFFPFVGKEGK